jgi:NAD(P)-dependent dehydrogenase (short-subunit alcohol dehydrogenase family)
VLIQHELSQLPDRRTFSAMTETPICLITGATEGVGRATALALARRGFTVVLAARNREKGEAVAAEIAAVPGNTGVELLVGDLASLRQTRGLAENFLSRHARLDVLINNAGVFLPARTLTEDGFETTYQVNYLSHFLLTRLCLGALGRSEQGRIINLSSSVHTVGRFDPHNLQSEHKFSVLGAYAASKLFMLMFTEELARRLGDTRITVNAVHPGIVRTPMMRRAPGAFRVLSLLSLPFSISPAEGARTSVHLATSPEVRSISGGYFADSRKVPAKSRDDTDENRALLWELSVASLEAGAARPAG